MTIKSIFRNELQKANTYFVFILHAVEISQFNFTKIIVLGLEKTRSTLLDSD